jgi:hypothetical protein
MPVVEPRSPGKLAETRQPGRWEQLAIECWNHGFLGAILLSSQSGEFLLEDVEVGGGQIADEVFAHVGRGFAFDDLHAAAELGWPARSSGPPAPDEKPRASAKAAAG